MTSQVPAHKLKALLKDSKTAIPPNAPDDDDEDADEAEKKNAALPENEADEADSDELEDGDEDGEEEGDEEEEQTVESLTESLKPAVADINEIIDEFRTGSDAQPKAGIETLEETEGLDAEMVHEFCAWTEDAGKKDFRKLGEALDLEDVDGFVGWCRAVRKLEEEGEGEGDGEDEEVDTKDGADESGAADETEDEGDED